MPREIRNKSFIYHLTSMDNIESILRQGLLPRNLIHAFDDVANQEIILYRRIYGLNDYVPFHFFSKNPFDGRVQLDYPHKDFVYICLQREYARSQNFKIIPMHPLSMGENLVLYNYDQGMDAIDWDTMEQTDYHDEYSKNICMAECLVNRIVRPFEFCSIYVKNERHKRRLEKLCIEIFGSIPFRISANPNMFVE